jgi:hypothetical protein
MPWVLLLPCGPKKRAKTDKADARHLRELLADGRLPECWIPPSHVLECRALLELYHDLRAGHTAWVQRIHAVLFHRGAQQLGEAGLRTGEGLAALRAIAAAQLSQAGQLQVATTLDMLPEGSPAAGVRTLVLPPPGPRGAHPGPGPMPRRSHLSLAG